MTSSPEVLGLDGEGRVGQDAEDDGRSSQNVVPEQKDKVEVSNQFKVHLREQFGSAFFNLHCRVEV